MLSHLSFGVSDLPRDGAGYGPPNGGDLLALKLQAGPVTPPGPGFHLAFAAGSRRAADDFHRAALAAGGKDNGAPGLRPRYAPDYYAAFVIDPEGYRLEAVTRATD
ncbi:Branched-chain amino acid transport system permease [Bosea sp. LC85]|uniref:VOC family protein n=1 Tax=Bosea sp. LC85 TaxID=1502851 RepID=UPI0004E3BCE7|nr:VOC family protein [Bosea sp. LC85]KFC73165.1 Branched-chain amino acid transport system permease [Bosea sp. LC85]